MFKCPKCGEYELKAMLPGKWVCDNFWCGYEYWEREPLYAPSPNHGGKYEMKRIHPNGKGNDKYYWFICTPDFPSEQHKINDPHCHARKNDWSGEARISLEPNIKLKVKLGKISGPDQTEIKKLVEQNKSYIYQEWRREWVR